MYLRDLSNQDTWSGNILTSHRQTCNNHNIHNQRRLVKCDSASQVMWYLQSLSTFVWLEILSIIQYQAFLSLMLSYNRSSTVWAIRIRCIVDFCKLAMLLLWVCRNLLCIRFLLGLVAVRKVGLPLGCFRALSWDKTTARFKKVPNFSTTVHVIYDDMCPTSSASQ